MLAHAQLAYAITNTDTLLRIPFFNPNNVATVGTVSGLVSGHTLSAIDFRPADANLYAVSRNATGTQGQLYQLNVDTAALTTIGSGFNLASNQSASRVSMNFDPVIDQLRIITSSGQNYRVNPNTGSLLQNDTNLNPGSPNVQAMAYTNSFIGASVTTLYGIETTDNFINLVTIGGIDGQPSANLGQLFNIANTGIIPGSFTIGFDVTSTSEGYVSIDLPGDANDRRYLILLNNGSVSMIGQFDQPLNSFSFALAAVPEPTVFLLVFAVGGAAVAHHRWKIYRQRKQLERL